MDRRRFHHAIAGATLATFALPGRSATAIVENTPGAGSFLNGLRGVLEIAAREALDNTPAFWPATIDGHLKESWSEWARYGANATTNSPWSRYEAFESFSRYTSKKVWQLARDSLFVQIYEVNESDVDKLKKAMGQKLTNGAWATAILEQKVGDRLMHRLLGEVTELHLAWLLENRDRYRNNPAARHAQLDMQDWEVCLRVTRALVFSIFDAVAEEERKLRLQPSKPGLPASAAAVLNTLGAPPKESMQRARQNALQAARRGQD